MGARNPFAKVPLPTFLDPIGRSFTPRFALRTPDENFLRELMARSSEDLFVVTDPSLADNPVVYASPSFYDFTGYTAEEVLGRNCRFLQGPLTREQDVIKIRRAVEKRRDVVLRIVNYKKDGEAFRNQFFLTCLLAEEGRRRARGSLRFRLRKHADRGDYGDGPGPRKAHVDWYYLGVFCECESADRQLISNFGANFRSKQALDSASDDAGSWRGLKSRDASGYIGQRSPPRKSDRVRRESKRVVFVDVHKEVDVRPEKSTPDLGTERTPSALALLYARENEGPQQEREYSPDDESRLVLLGA